MSGKSGLSKIAKTGIGSLTVIGVTGGMAISGGAPAGADNPDWGCNPPGTYTSCHVQINRFGTFPTIQGYATNLTGQCNIAVYNGTAADISAANNIGQTNPTGCYSSYYDILDFYAPKSGSGAHTYTAVLWENGVRGAVATDTQNF